MDSGPSDQLAQEIEHSLGLALRRRRPLLHHLNADSSWLLQLPRPIHSIPHSGRHWFNILIDPWLIGSQSDVAAWFSTQRHADPPAVGSVAAVEDLAREIERLSANTAGSALGKRKRDTHDACTPKEDTALNGDTEGGEDARHSLIDAIAISHEFTDHCHHETLLQCSPHIPVFATAKAVDVVKSFKHFHNVLETPPFGAETLDWRDISVPPLPEWLAIGRMLSGGDALYYHSALFIAFDCKDVSNKETKRSSMNGYANGFPAANGHGGGLDHAAEAVIYTPHGIEPHSLRCIPEASPRIETLAFLHGLHSLAISGQQLNLGAHNGLEAQRLLKAKYWVGTHDAIKVAGGLVRWFLKRKLISLEDALRDEAEQGRIREKGETGFVGKEAKMALEDVQFRELKNGESSALV